MGPADAAHSLLTLSDRTAKCGDRVEISVDSRDIHGRLTTLGRDGTARASSVSSELAVAIRGPGGPVCYTRSAVCPVGYCRNGGTCTPGTDGNARCNCTSGNEGAQCEIHRDPCVSADCGSGECVPGLGDEYCCVCPVGTGGRGCEFDAASLCDNFATVSEACCDNGTCRGSRDPQHSCSSGCAAVAQPFIEHCGSLAADPMQFQIFKSVLVASLHGLCNASTCKHPSLTGDTDPCASSPCVNGGTCQNTGFGTFECACDEMWRGSHCQLAVPECPTFHNDQSKHVTQIFETAGGERNDFALIAGKYSLSVRLRDAELLQSSGQLLTLYPAELSYALSVADFSYNLTEAGRSNSYWVVPRDSFGNVRDPTTVAEFALGFHNVTSMPSTRRTMREDDFILQDFGPVTTAWDSHMSAVKLAFTAYRAAELAVRVYISGRELIGSPFDLTVVPGPYNHTISCASFTDPPAQLTAGVEGQVNVTAYDDYNNTRANNQSDFPTATLQPDELTDDASNVTSWAYHSFSGMFTISFMANRTGRYGLSVSLGGLSVLGSPFSIVIKQTVVDIDRCTIHGYSDGISMPGVLNSIQVTIRDMFDNVINAGEPANYPSDKVKVQIQGAGYGSDTDTAPVRTIDWNLEGTRVNVNFTFSSPTEYAYSVSVLVEISETETLPVQHFETMESFETMQYVYAFHTNLNASACSPHALDCAQAMTFNRDMSWDHEAECREVGCLYRSTTGADNDGSQWEILQVHVAQAVLAQRIGGKPSLRIFPSSCGSQSDALYWKDPEYCTTNRESNCDSQSAISDPDSPEGSFAIRFFTQRP